MLYSGPLLGRDSSFVLLFFRFTDWLKIDPCPLCRVSGTERAQSDTPAEIFDRRSSFLFYNTGLTSVKMLVSV